MIQELEELNKDLSNHKLPKDWRSFDKVKCELKPGQRVHWYYREDLEFAQEEDFDIRLNATYSGIVVQKPSVERHSIIDPDEAVIIIDCYPVEKHNPEIDWVALKRIVDDPELIEVF